MVRAGSSDRVRAAAAAVALAACVWAGTTGRAQTARPSDLPSPEQFFGFQMGADRKLANWDKLHEYYQTLADAYASRLAEAQEKREVRQGHPEAQAWALMGIAHFLGLRYAIWDRSAPPEAVLETTFELLTAGLAGEREAGA